MKLYFNSNLSGEVFVDEVPDVKDAYNAMDNYLYDSGYHSYYISQMYSTNDLELRFSIGQGGESFVLRNT